MSENLPDDATHRVLPEWDGNSLKFRGETLFTLSGKAKNQREILNAFHAAGWPDTITNPWLDESRHEIMVIPTMTAKAREAVTELNKRTTARQQSLKCGKTIR